MNRPSCHRIGSKCIWLAGILLVASVATAGPPMICHTIETGGAETLPGGDSDWRVYKTEYDLTRLVGDTLALLTPGTPVLERMETLRRATVHGKKDPGELGRLVAELEARAERGGAADPLALFDLGYIRETIKQYNWTLKLRVLGFGKDGYPLVQRALELSGGDPQMEFAAALITSHPRQPSHARHLAAAVAGADDGSLLASNLVRHFGDTRAETLAELRARVAD